MPNEAVWITKLMILSCALRSRMLSRMELICDSWANERSVRILRSTFSAIPAHVAFGKFRNADNERACSITTLSIQIKRRANPDQCSYLRRHASRTLRKNTLSERIAKVSKTFIRTRMPRRPTKFGSQSATSASKRRAERKRERERETRDDPNSRDIHPYDDDAVPA